MGFFSKTSRPNPKITVGGLEIEYQRDSSCWSFHYQGTTFCSFEPVFAVPNKGDLEAIVEAVQSLKPELRARLEKGLAEWGEGARLDDGESYHVDTREFISEKAFTVSYFGGKSWGDLGADFRIKDGKIADESWGD